MRIEILGAVLWLLILAPCPARASQGPYLGCRPPGAVAELFAPGIVSTGLFERDLAISPDGHEIYWTVAGPAFGSAAIVWSRLGPEGWTAPAVVPGLDDPAFRYLEPAVSPDGRQFFYTRMPTEASGESTQADLWMRSRTTTGWGEPRPLGAPVNTDGGEFFPAPTLEGSLYFTREPKNGRDAGIYRSRCVTGRYLEPERLPVQVNAGDARFNAFVDPAERYLIVPVSGRPDSLGGVDYYVVFHEAGDRWSEPVNLSAEVNTAGSGEYAPSVSPDGKYLFFMSSRRAQAGTARLDYRFFQELSGRPGNGNADVYWIAWPPLLARARAALVQGPAGGGSPQ